MSDHSISIVPRRSNYADKHFKAEEILQWLVSLDIIKPVLSDCVLSASNGYAISKGARIVTNEPDSLPFDLITNGLEIIVERTVFHTGENGIKELICPTCKQDISTQDWDFLSEWGDNKSNNLTCPLCGVAKEIHSFAFTPQWGFSDFAFTFWNWPELKDEFVREFELKLNCDIDIVLTWI